MASNAQPVTWALLLLSIALASSQDLYVGLDSRWCRLDGPELTCNFEGTRQMVLMTENLNSSVWRASIHNVNKLHLSESLCVNVSLTRVSEVVVVRGDQESCQHGADLTARDSMLDRLPNQVTQLHLENSRITSLSSASVLTNITAINSHVDVLDVTKPREGQKSFVIFEDSAIRKIEKLETNDGSFLTMTRTTVDVVASKGLVLFGTQVFLDQTVLWPLADDSVVLGHESSLTLENCPGKFSFKTLMSRSPLMDVNNRIDTQISKANYFVGFVVCFVMVIVLCFISIFACVRLRRERTRGRSDYLIKGVKRKDSPATYNFSSSKFQKSFDPETSISTRPLMNTMNNFEEKVGNDMQNYLQEITRIGESISTIHEQKACDIASLRTSRAERIIELHSKYSTLRQISSEIDAGGFHSSSEDESPAKEKQNRMKKKEELKSQGTVNSLLAMEKAKLSLLESEFDDKIFEIMVSSWNSEVEQKRLLAQVKDSFISCLKENRDSAMLQLFKIYENDFDQTRKVRLAKDFLTRTTGKMDEEFKDQLSNQKIEHKDERRTTERQADDRIRILKTRYEANKDSIAGKAETGSSRPKNEDFNDLFQALAKSYDVTYNLDAKKASAEADPKLELRQQDDVIHLKEKYITQLMLLVDFILLLGNILRHQI